MPIYSYCSSDFLLNEIGLDRHSGILISAIEEKMKFGQEKHGMNLIKLQKRNLQKTIALTSPELQYPQLHLFLWAELKHCKFFCFVL